KRISIIISMFLLVSAARVTAITVTTTNDSGPGSLRQAITDANANAGADTIDFNIPGAGQQTITVSSNLPDIVPTVIIDGGHGGVATNRVELSGAGIVGVGLFVNTAAADGSEVRNLVINGFTTRQILPINS